MTIHFVYPYDPAIKAAPWSIGNHVAAGLRARGHAIKQYDWEDTTTIIPAPGDVLLGHFHPRAGHVFGNSMTAFGRARTIGLWPMNVPYENVALTKYVVSRCKVWLGISGPRWAHMPAKWGIDNITLVDMAIDPDDYPPLNRTPNPPGQRRFLYIGCCVPDKGTDRLRDLAAETGYHVGHIGYGTVGTPVVDHGFLDVTKDNVRGLISTYDYLLMTSVFDANPTVVLEACCWGLAPLCSDGCGWPWPLAQDGPITAAHLQTAQWDPAPKHPAYWRSFAEPYTWDRFVDAVEAACLTR